MPSKRSLQAWRTVIDVLVADDMSSFLVWVWLLYILGSLWCSDVLKSLSWMWRAWGVCMGSRVGWSSSVVWMWPWEVLVSWWPSIGSGSTNPCPSIQLANLLTNEEIGHIVPRTLGDYFEFVQAQLQGCLANISGTLVTFILFQINLHHDSHHHLSFSSFFHLQRCLNVAFLGFIL